MPKVKIVKGNTLKIEMDKDDIVEVAPSYDGVHFKCKNGILIENVDNNMPTETKRLMKATLENFTKGSITFRLDPEFYNQPAAVDAK